ncbi:hypothetical protein HNQ71_006404 [Mesorhizobium sangaii]|uniref:Uncharacterized protein n=1 Tax=Mesorhizobium sangaii TaxID=505389 RepID=A0A841PY90_9HYPH|nr:hypothetical protein [Mesorhizobium sangaii]
MVLSREAENATSVRHQIIRGLQRQRADGPKHLPKISFSSGLKKPNISRRTNWTKGKRNLICARHGDLPLNFHPAAIFLGRFCYAVARVEQSAKTRSLRSAYLHRPDRHGIAFRASGLNLAASCPTTRTRATNSSLPQMLASNVRQCRTLVILVSPLNCFGMIFLWHGTCSVMCIWVAVEEKSSHDYPKSGQL